MPSLLAALHPELARVANRANAPAMQAYMKSSTPFLGVSARGLRQVCRRVFAGLEFPTAASWRRAVLGVWRRARYREERYAALDLLYACIEPSLSSREFFLQKAIGWALRQHAWTDAAEVHRYVRIHERELSALSRREALKNIGPRRRR